MVRSVIYNHYINFKYTYGQQESRNMFYLADGNNGNTYLKNKIMVCCLLVCPHAWCSCAAEGHAPARQKMRHNKPSDSFHRRNRDNIPSLSLHLPRCTARCGPRSTSLSLFSPTIHLSLHVRTTLRPGPTAGRHSFTSDGLIMAPLSPFT